MTNKQKFEMGCAVAQAAGALVVLIGIIGEVIVKNKGS